MKPFQCFFLCSIVFYPYLIDKPVVLQFALIYFLLFVKLVNFFVLSNLLNKHVNQCHEKSFFISFILNSAVYIFFVTLSVLVAFYEIIIPKKSEMLHDTVFFKFSRLVKLSVFIVWLSEIFLHFFSEKELLLVHISS